MAKQRASVKGLGRAIFSEPVDSEHPVESFTEESPSTTILNIPIEHILQNPDQPRKYFSESSLQELAESIKSRGLIQPVIVARKDSEFLLMAGERRYRAAKIAGLTKIPCIIRSDDPLELAIIENLQREDLTPIEEAEGLKALSEKFQYSHEDLAKIIGKSRPTITEILSLTRLPKPVKDECRTSDNWPKSLLLQVVRQPDEDSMVSSWNAVKKRNLSVKAARELKPNKSKKAEKKRAFIHTYRSPDKSYTVTIRFRKSEVTNEEIIGVLERMLEGIKTPHAP